LGCGEFHELFGTPISPLIWVLVQFESFILTAALAR